MSSAIPKLEDFTAEAVVAFYRDFVDTGHFIGCEEGDAIAAGRHNCSSCGLYCGCDYKDEGYKNDFLSAVAQAYSEAKVEGGLGLLMRRVGDAALSFRELGRLAN